MTRESILPIFFFSTLVALFLAACQTTPTPTEPQGARLRITNSGSEPIEDLVVLFPEEHIAIGDVAPGETTDYFPVSRGVYNYGAYEYSLNGETVSQPVIDWVGETPKLQGDFTYVLAYHPDQPNRMQIELVEVTQE